MYLRIQASKQVQAAVMRLVRIPGGWRKKKVSQDKEAKQGSGSRALTSGKVRQRRQSR